MSALVMILTAAMVVPADGPEKVSGEVERRLDLSGRWQGTYPSVFRELITKVEVSDGRIRFYGENGTNYSSRWKVIDEGRGNLRIEYEKDETELGIYRWRGEQLFICTRVVSKGRPTAFRVAGSNNFSSVLILHRVKSRK